MTRGGTSAGPVTARIRLPDQSAVRFEAVAVTRRGQTRLERLDLAIPRNTCFGVVGHPGSGVDVVAQLLATRRRPTSGVLRVLGMDVWDDPAEVRHRVGHLPYPHAVPSHVRVKEYLSSLAAAHGVPRDRHAAVIDTLLTLVGLAGRQDLMTEELSPGARQLLAVAGALVHDPTVVVLEEPSVGLDARSRARLWHMLHRLLELSRTVIVCTRELSEVVAGCSELAVFSEGRLLDHGTPTEVTERLGGARRIRARLVNGAVRTHTVADERAQAALLRKLVEGGVDLIEFTEVAPELDDLPIPGPRVTSTSMNRRAVSPERDVP